MNVLSCTRVFLLVWVTCLGLFSAKAQACDKTINVGTNERYWPPYVVLKNNTLTGVEIDIIKTIFKDSPFCINFTLLPNSLRALEELKHGRVDLMFAASKTRERQAYAHFSLPYREEVMLLYKHAGSASISSLEQLFKKGLTAGVNRGSFLGHTFKTLSDKYSKQIVLTSDADKRFALLNKKRVDFVVDDSLVAHHFANKYTAILPVEQVAPINVNNVHFMMSKKTISLEEVNTINAHIVKNKAALKALFK